MDAPILKTSLPGPKAAALIARDKATVSPSYTRDYPLVMAGGQGAVVEDVDGNLFLDCAAGIAVNATGHAHPDVVKAIVDQAQRYLHMSGTDFYYEPQVQLAEEMADIAPIAGAGAIVLRQLGHRGRRGVDQAGEVSHEAVQHHRVSRLVPRPHHGVAVADVEQADPAQGLRAADARRVSRAVRELLSLSGRARRRTTARPSASASSRTRSWCTSCRPTKWRPSSSSRSRARAATSCRRRRSISGCAS